LRRGITFHTAGPSRASYSLTNPITTRPLSVLMSGSGSHPMAKALKDSYEAMLRGDVEPSRKLYWPDFVMHVPGRMPISGDVHGWDEVLRWDQRFFDRVGKTWHEEVLSVVANDDWAFMLLDYHVELNGRKVEDKGVQVYRLKNGRVTEMWVFVGDSKVFDEMFG